MCNANITELEVAELGLVGGGIPVIPQVFTVIGIVSSIEWAAEKAYEAGKWVGSH